MAEKQFVNGIRFKEVNENVPDWIKMKFSINRLQLLEWLQNESDEWIEIDVKESKAGKLYCEVNTWKPDNSVTSDSNSDESSVEVPF